MRRLLAPCCLVFFLSAVPVVQAKEEPPYAPPVAPGVLSTYTNSDLQFTLAYPAEFVLQTPEDLAAVMDRGHRAAFGSAPESDSEHQKALQCMKTLFYATDAPEKLRAQASDPKPSTGLEEASSIMVVDFASSCIPPGMKGDKILSSLTGTILNLPGASQVVPQMWFVAGDKRRIHSGMSATRLSVGSAAAPNGSRPAANDITLFVLAASFEQKGHLLLVAYLRGATEVNHEAIRNMAVSFEGGRDILVYPFLLGQTHLKR